jgi:hypothetical protein
MTDFIKTWGVFPWNPEHGQQHIHADDIALAKKYLPSFCVFECTGESGEYITLQYKDLALRVKPNLFKKVTSPISVIGDNVRILSGSSQGKEAKVENLTWHFKNSEVMYSLKIDGKLSSRQYTSIDIEPAQ